MTSDVEVDDGDEARWAQAESILRAQPTEDARRGIRRRRVLLWSLVAGFTVLGLGLGVLLVLLLGGHRRHAEPSGWQVAVGFTLSGCGLVLTALSLVLIIRRGRWGQAYRSPSAVLAVRQRRYVMAQIRGRRPADPQRLGLTRDLAQRLEEQMRLTLPIFIGVALINFGNVLQARDAFHYVFVASWVAFLLLVLVLWGRQRRKARRFLEEHPASEN